MHVLARRMELASRTVEVEPATEEGDEEDAATTTGVASSGWRDVRARSGWPWPRALSGQWMAGTVVHWPCRLNPHSACARSARILWAALWPGRPET